jgi:hypothetical protein
VDREPIGPPLQLNAVIASYGAANNVPVINYGDALCGCLSSVTPNSYSDVGYDIYQQYGLQNSAYLVAPAVSQPFPDNYSLIPSASGYAMMTQMLQSTLATMNLTLLTGWLQNVQQVNENEVCCVPPKNVNTVRPQAVVQFTPVGYYSDGSQHPLLNTNFQGASGTWTSSNPVVMYVNQDGLAWALSPGTAIIRYTSSSGVAFSEAFSTGPRMRGYSSIIELDDSQASLKCLCSRS